MLLRIINGFERLSGPELLERANCIYSCVNGNPHFSNPVPSLPVLQSAIDNFRTALVAAGTGDRLAIGKKNVERTALIDTLHLLSYYVLFAAGGNAIIAMSSGFTLAKEPSTSPELQKPGNLQVINSSQTGELLVSVARVNGAKAYMHQYSTDPQLKQESWMSISGTQTKCKLGKLMPGTTYYIRVAAIGTREQVMYSDVVSKIVA